MSRYVDEQGVKILWEQIKDYVARQIGTTTSTANDVDTFIKENFEVIEVDGTKVLRVKRGIVSDSFISAMGINTSASGGGGGIGATDLLQEWDEYNIDTAQNTALSASLGKQMNDNLSSLNSLIGDLSLNSNAVRIVTEDEYKALKVKEFVFYAVMKGFSLDAVYFGTQLFAKRSSEAQNGFAYNFPITF